MLRTPPHAHGLTRRHRRHERRRGGGAADIVMVAGGEEYPRGASPIADLVRELSSPASEDEAKAAWFARQSAPDYHGAKGAPHAHRAAPAAGGAPGDDALIARATDAMLDELLDILDLMSSDVCGG